MNPRAPAATRCRCDYELRPAIMNPRPPPAPAAMTNPAPPRAMTGPPPRCPAGAPVNIYKYLPGPAGSGHPARVCAAQRRAPRSGAGCTAPRARVVTPRRSRGNAPRDDHPCPRCGVSPRTQVPAGPRLRAAPRGQVVPNLAPRCHPQPRAGGHLRARVLAHPAAAGGHIMTKWV